MRKLTFIAAAVSVALVGRCQQMQEQPKPAPVQSQPVQSEIDKANAFFEDTFKWRNEKPYLSNIHGHQKRLRQMG